MRLCRFRLEGTNRLGLYDERVIVPLEEGAKAYRTATGRELSLPQSDDLLDFLPPDGSGFPAVRTLSEWVADFAGEMPPNAAVSTEAVQLLVPVPRPNKLFLLAGNYGAHIEEGGEKAREREETFPYVFMKPPTTTLTNPGMPVCIPTNSPHFIDWELELAVVIGREAKHVKEGDALAVVAGYTVINDISNRKFRPNPNRKERPKDGFFDWLHGKWFDSFCPCGPCVLSADSVTDPQSMSLLLKVNGDVKQDASTAQQIFPVAAVIEFISSIVTLEPGDIISTGTPSGVGNSSGTYLKPGDVIEAHIGSIGTLLSPVEAATD